MLRLTHQETPSRILRRIRAAERDTSDLPSLPSFAEGSEDGETEMDTTSRTRDGQDALGGMESVDGEEVDKSGRAPVMGDANKHGRNVLSPLRLNTAGNARQREGTLSKESNKLHTVTRKPASPSSARPLSTVSSNNTTVRPRQTSETPSANVGRRKANKKTARRALSDSETSAQQSPSVSYASSSFGADQPRGREEDGQQQGPLDPDNLRFDDDDDSEIPDRPRLLTSLGSDNGGAPNGHANANAHPAYRPTPLKNVAFHADDSSLLLASRDSSVQHLSGQQQDLSLPPALPVSPTSEGHSNIYDYTTASPSAAAGPASAAGNARQNYRQDRRGSTDSSASASAASDAPQIEVTPAPANMTRARRVVIRSNSAEPLADDSIGTTPGMGRRLPSAERRANRSTSLSIDRKLIYGDSQDLDATDATPSKASSSGTPIPAPSTAVTSRAYSYTNTPSALATPRPAETDADLERRKMHLLSTLRMTALKSSRKLSRFAKGTPHPRDRRARSLTPGLANESRAAGITRDESLSGRGENDLTAMSSSSALSEASSTDLTTHPRGHGNTSLPLGGGVATDGGITLNNRFNNSKLNNYLHTLNTHLTTENQNLVKTLEETAREVTRLMRKNEDLSRLNGSHDETTSASQQHASRIIEEEEEGDATREILQSHQRTSDDISRLREHLTGDASQAVSTSKLQQDLRAKDNELDRLRAQLAQRDTEIAAMRADVLRSSGSASGGPNQSEDGPLPHQQIFDLRDELGRAKAELSVQSAELARVRAEQVAQSGRHNTLVADLQSRTEELIIELEEKDAIVEDLENELQQQEEDFRTKMANLEDDLCKVMEEQEGRLKESKKELEALREEGAMSLRGSQARTLKSQVSELEETIATLREQNEQLAKSLQHATSKVDKPTVEGDDSGQSSHAAGHMALLESRLDSVQKSLADKQSLVSAAQNELAQAREDSTKQQTALAESEEERSTLSRKLTAQGTVLRETEKALADAEENARACEAELDTTRRQLEELHAELRDLKTEQINLMDSNLQQKYDAAMREIGKLKHQLAFPAPRPGKDGANDSRDVQIKTLQSSNHELETRVTMLKRQAMMGRQSPKQASSPNGSEKSVRFDSIQSMRTPRSATQMMAGMSWLDKSGSTSAANATASPLYAEIDLLNGQVQQYRKQLDRANDEVDDKLRKLNAAGSNAVSLTKELEEAKLLIRSLQKNGARGADEGDLMRELLAVKKQLTDERSTLMRKLQDIQEQCRHVSSQLEMSQSAHAVTQRRLDAQTVELYRTQGRPVSSGTVASAVCTDPRHTELVTERDAIIAGVAALKRDLNSVQREALNLGQDLNAARLAGGTALGACSKAECASLQLKSREEAGGLLLMISHLKAKFTRESYHRADLAHQKLYLNLLITQKDARIEAVNTTLARFGMPPPAPESRSRPTLRVAAQAVLATVRMKKLSDDWKKQGAVKAALKEAYKRTRGKPFVPARQ